jgi:AraC-like DNA-binding protein
MELLRDTDRPVTEVCLDVGFASLGTFSRTFSAVVGASPSAYRARALARRDATGHGGAPVVPSCLEKVLRRPVGAPAAKSSPGEARRVAAL